MPIRKERVNMKDFELKGFFRGKNLISEFKLKQLVKKSTAKKTPHNEGNYLVTVDNQFNLNGKKYLVLAHFYNNGDKLRLKFYYLGNREIDAFFI